MKTYTDKNFVKPVSVKDKIVNIIGDKLIGYYSKGKKLVDITVKEELTDQEKTALNNEFGIDLE